MPINEISLRRRLNQTVASSKRMEGFARVAANTKYQFALRDLEKNINEDPVSKEITEACKNPSITQKDIISKGNIASAIGFHVGSEPIEELKDLLVENIQMDDKAKISVGKSEVDFAFKVNIPSRNEINSALSGHGVDEWTTRSWLDMIEKGIPYLAKYIFWSAGFPEDAGSRSGTGLQSKGKVKNQAEFTPRKDYLSKIIEKFVARFK